MNDYTPLADSCKEVRSKVTDTPGCHVEINITACGWRIGAANKAAPIRHPHAEKRSRRDQSSSAPGRRCDPRPSAALEKVKVKVGATASANSLLVMA